MAARLLGDLFRMALHHVRASARPSLSALALNTVPIHEALAHAARHHAQLQNPNARRSRVAAGAGCSCFPFPELKHLVTPTCPFMNLPETRRSRFGGELNAEKMKKAVWLRPEAVAQFPIPTSRHRSTHWTKTAYILLCCDASRRIRFSLNGDPYARIPRHNLFHHYSLSHPP